MELKNKKILIISPESWGKSYLSKHHYALELVKRGNEVWFLNSPFFVTDDEAGRVEEEYPNLHIMDERPVKGLTRLPSFFQRIIIRKQARLLQKRLNVKFDIVWSFDNSRYFYLNAFEAAIRIHHLVDGHMKYELAKACKSAHLCLAVTKELQDMCASFNQHSHFIQHGFAEFEFSSHRIERNHFQTHAAYVGNLLLEAFDVELMKQLAIMNPNTCFHLVGTTVHNHLNHSVDKTRIQLLQELRQLHNVKFYGEQSYNAAFSIAAQCDVMLLMYFSKKYDLGNSSKILPYLATGKVVITDYMAEYEKWNVLQMTKTREGYLSLFSNVLGELSVYNSEHASEKRRTFAQQNTYANQVDIIEQLINTISI